MDEPLHEHSGDNMNGSNNPHHHNNHNQPPSSGGPEAASNAARKRLKRRRELPPASLQEATLTNSNLTFTTHENGLVDHHQLQPRPPTPTEMEQELLKRLTQLEHLVSAQAVEIKRLKEECRDLTHAAAAFAKVVELLRDAGLSAIDGDEVGPVAAGNGTTVTTTTTSHRNNGTEVETIQTVMEAFDDAMIFGRAPSSVIEAADGAGAAILAGMLGGKQRMLVDVRDAELSRDPETLVQFIELAILPVAAGLEGLKSKRNRLKVVFPTVGQLLEYRKTMALSAPEVVALSTLAFDPVESCDNLVVIIAPAPNDEEGMAAMNELLEPSDPSRTPVKQPVVVLNHHMAPIRGPAASFEVAYHLRLLSVQYMSSSSFTSQEAFRAQYLPHEVEEDVMVDEDGNPSSNASATEDLDIDDANDAALEAAMKHAHEVGMQSSHHGLTRAMVIRAYPKPWHVFVDTSPDTDADFEVAATFDHEPTQDDVNLAIVECLEGSQQEDELVAQQMQEALETGQLDRVSEMLGSLGLAIFDDEDNDPDDERGYLWDLFNEDSV